MQGKLSFLFHRLREVSWRQGGHVGLFCLYSRKCEACSMPVKSIDNWPGGRGFMAPRCRWRPKLRDTHKPFNQATFVTGPRTCLLGTFPNIPPILNASRSKLIATIELKLIKNLNYLKNITYTKEDIVTSDDRRLPSVELSTRICTHSHT